MVDNPFCLLGRNRDVLSIGVGWAIQISCEVVSEPAVRSSIWGHAHSKSWSNVPEDLKNLGSGDYTSMMWYWDLKFKWKVNIVWGISHESISDK